MYWGYDSTYLLLIIGMLITAAATARLNSVYGKYRKVRSASGMTGAEAAQRILRAAGISDVSIGMVNGSLSDHYDPISKRVNLSREIYEGTSLASVGVAAHECGHAIQHAHGYAPLNFRSALVPIANFGSRIAWPLIIIGFLISSRSSILLIDLGVLAFSLSVLFQLVTLPVEFNASNRAMRILSESAMLQGNELRSTRKVLTAAALTYVASAAAAILQLLRLVLLTRGRRD